MTASCPLRILSNDARVKSLKPRCACTGVVLWLNDPPRYKHKSEVSASRYANIGKNCGSTKYGTIRMASFDPDIIYFVYQNF